MGPNLASGPWVRHYPEGLSGLPAPESETLGGLLNSRVTDSPHAVALKTGRRSVSYAQVGDRAAGVAAAVALDRGPVLLLAPNGPAFVAGVFGVALAGRQVAPVSPTVTAAELGPIVDELGPGDALIAEGTAPAATALLRGRGLAVHDLDRIGSSPFGRPPATPSADAPAVLQLTSGTTGGLKAAMMSHRNLLANAWQNNVWFGWSETDVILGALPLYHTWGLSCVLLAAFAARAPVILLDRPTPDMLVSVMRRHRPTILYGSATMFDRLLDVNGAAAACSCLRYVKAGAMLVGGRLPDRWRERVPSVPMILGYGLTEASPEVCNNPPARPKPGTVGVPLPGTEVRIGDPADPARILGWEEVGEILVRGPQVMLGYYRRPVETAAALGPEGWLHTGDLGWMDAEGYVTIVDRLKDLIKHRGWSVIPAEVERALMDHPAVIEAIVVGAPHDRDGEVVVAFLVGDQAAAAPEVLDRFLEGRIASFKRPARYEWVAEIPKNAVGKPLRRTLRARAATGSASPAR